MNSPTLSKKQHASQFAELLEQANLKREIWTAKVADERAARNAGIDDLMLENAKLDADEDYKIALCDLHVFLLMTSYTPPKRSR